MTATAAASPRVVLLRPDHLGDVLLALPAAQLFRSLLPAAHITVGVTPGLAQLATRCPAVDDVLAIDFPPPTAPDNPPGWAGRALVVADGIRDRFDVALIPRLDDPWSGHLAALAGIPRRIGFDHPRTQRFLTEALPLPARCHVVDLGLAVARHAAGAARSSLEHAPWIVPRAEDEEELDRVLETTGMGGKPPGDQIVALHPGSSWRLKEWPAARWGALAQGLWRQQHITALVTGSAQEQGLVDAIVQAGAGRATSLAGMLSLGGLAALYRRAALVIATDSGPLHLAVATGTRVVGLYGPADPAEFGPWSSPGHGRVIQTRLPCQPCRRLSAPPCGALEHPACVTGIAVDEVLAIAAAALDDALSRPR